MSTPQFDVCIAVNYYAPYVSGVTEVARVLAEGLAARGRSVAVVASRHDPALPRRERIAGVEVFRSPVLGHIGRGVVSPGFPRLVARVAARSAVVNLHLPMLEAGAVTAAIGGSRPIVSTHHIDVWVPRTPTSIVAMAAVNRSVAHTLRHSDHVVVNSRDQAEHSMHWPTIAGRSWGAIPPPCLDRGRGTPRHRSGSGLHVGFLGRIVEDKGIPYLVEGFRRHAGPDDRLLIGGDYENVRGGSTVDEVRAAAGDDPRVELLGLLRGREIDDFYASLDVFALPSVAESFGIVQAEAMMSGVPCVTTDLPGGRHPVAATGFGATVAPRDPDALWDGVERLRGLGVAERAAGAATARRLFSVEACLDGYEEAFARVDRRAALPVPQAVAA